jgi:hypothetical protein
MKSLGLVGFVTSVFHLTSNTRYFLGAFKKIRKRHISNRTYIRLQRSEVFSLSKMLRVLLRGRLFLDFYIVSIFLPDTCIKLAAILPSTLLPVFYWYLSHRLIQQHIYTQIGFIKLPRNHLTSLCSYV